MFHPLNCGPPKSCLNINTRVGFTWRTYSVSHLASRRRSSPMSSRGGSELSEGRSSRAQTRLGKSGRARRELACPSRLAGSGGGLKSARNPERNDIGEADGGQWSRDRTRQARRTRRTRQSGGFESACRDENPTDNSEPPRVFSESGSPYKTGLWIGMYGLMYIKTAWCWRTGRVVSD